MEAQLGGGRSMQDRPPNFRDEAGELFLVRCYAPGHPERGIENWGPAVALGQCAWCGWKESVDNENHFTAAHTQNPDLENV